MRGHTGSLASPNSGFNLTLDGGNSNVIYDAITDQDYPYLRRRIPYDAFSGSAFLNPISTGSHYKRYIFKGEQLYWRPDDNGDFHDGLGYDVTEIRDWTTSSTEYELLSGSNV